MPSKCTHSGFIATPLRHPDARILWVCHACSALKTDVQNERIVTLEDEIAAWKAEKEDQRIYANQQRERAEEAEAERDRLKPIVEDLAAMLPRMPVELFHYNPAVPWKALAVRAVEVLAYQESND